MNIGTTELHAFATKIVGMAKNADEATEALRGVGDINGADFISITRGSTQNEAALQALDGIDAALVHAKGLPEHTGPLMHGTRGASQVREATEHLSAAKAALDPARMLEKGAESVTIDMGSAKEIFKARNISGELKASFGQEFGREVRRLSQDFSYLAKSLPEG